MKIKKKTKNQVDLEHTFAVAVSTFTNPFLIILFVFLTVNLTYILNTFEDLMVFLIITIIPCFIYYIYLIKQHKEHPLHFAAISQLKRNALYLFCLYCLAFNIVFFVYLEDKFWLLHTMLFLIAMCFFYLINKYIAKASMHAAAYAFAILYLADRVNMAFAILFVGLPVVFWSRIKLHKHSWLELLLGATIGMIIGLLSWTIR